MTTKLTKAQKRIVVRVMEKNVYDYCKKELNLTDDEELKDFNLKSYCGQECKKIIDGLKLTVETLGSVHKGAMQQVQDAIEVLWFS